MKTQLMFSASVLVCLATIGVARAGVVISPAAGYNITWDGNDADHFNPGAVAPVPTNLALASNGAIPFASGELSGFAHFTAEVNDGFYGNSNSWIGDGPTPAFIGIDISGGAGTLYNLTSFAFGRDNGNGAHDDSSNPGIDACDGQCDDRSLGVFDIQITTDGSVGAASAWTSIGTLDYQSSDDIALGGLFTSYFRHEYGITSAGGGSVAASGFRIIVPATGLGGGTAVDEIELYGAVIPEPSTILLAVMGLAAMLTLGWRRRRAV